MPFERVWVCGGLFRLSSGVLCTCRIYVKAAPSERFVRVARCDGLKNEILGRYLEKIKPNCDWIEGAFTKRAEARKKESEGLQQAKAILAGSEVRAP